MNVENKWKNTIKNGSRNIFGICLIYNFKIKFVCLTRHVISHVTIQTNWRFHLKTFLLLALVDLFLVFTFLFFSLNESFCSNPICSGHIINRNSSNITLNHVLKYVRMKKKIVFVFFPDVKQKRMKYRKMY